jgi:hypothetical protein
MELDPSVRMDRACTAWFHDHSQGANLGLIPKDGIADSYVACARERA